MIVRFICIVLITQRTPTRDTSFLPQYTIIYYKSQFILLIEYTFSVLYSETFTFYLLRFLREYSLSVTFPLIESRFFQISLQLWFILYQQHFFSSFIKSISKRRHMSNITIFPSTFYCNHLLPIDKFFREIFSGSCHIPTFF